MLPSSSLALLATNVVSIFLAAVSVMIRFYVRGKKAALGCDDYLIIAALLCSTFLAIVNIVGVPWGHIGEAFEQLDETEAENFLKIAFIMQFPYVVAVALVKLSVLCFYGRIFQLGRWPFSIKLFIATVTGWLIAFFIATLFQAWPMSCNWTPCEPTMNYAVMYVACSATEIALDIAILALPMSFLQQVRMSRNQKVGVVGIFGLGIFCVVSSICRLVFTIMFEQVGIADYSINFDVSAVNIIMWSGIEANASTLCACLPTYYPFFAKLRQLGFLPRDTSVVYSLPTYRESCPQLPDPRAVAISTQSHDTLNPNFGWSLRDMFGWSQSAPSRQAWSRCQRISTKDMFSQGRSVSSKDASGRVTQSKDGVGGDQALGSEAMSDLSRSASSKDGGSSQTRIEAQPNAAR